MDLTLSCDENFAAWLSCGGTGRRTPDPFSRIQVGPSIHLRNFSSPLNAGQALGSNLLYCSGSTVDRPLLGNGRTDCLELFVRGDLAAAAGNHAEPLGLAERPLWGTRRSPIRRWTTLRSYSLSTCDTRCPAASQCGVEGAGTDPIRSSGYLRITGFAADGLCDRCRL